MNFYHVCCQNLFRGNVTCSRTFKSAHVRRAAINAKDALREARDTNTKDKKALQKPALNAKDALQEARSISAKDALQDVTPDENSQQLHTSIQTKIKKASTANDLLGMISDPAFSSVHACSALKYLGDFVKKDEIDPKVLVSNSLYKENCRKVKSNLEKIPAFSLLLALQGLYKIGAESQRDVINLVQSNLNQTSRLMNMRPLITLFVLQQANARTVSDKKLLRNVAANIQRRWVEIQNTDDIIAILSHNVEHFSKEFLDKLEDALLEKVPAMTQVQLRGTLTALGKLRHRHLPLLRAVAFHLSDSDAELKLDHITSALFSFCVLSFVQSSFTDKIGKELVRDIPTARSKEQITSLNTSIGIIRWKNADVLDAIEQWLIKNNDKMTKKDATAYIMAAASVNHRPHNDLQSVIDSALSAGESSNVNHGWLVDVVWAYTVLGQTTGLVQLLLNTDISVKALSTGRRLKLQQIIQWAQIENLKIPNILEEAAIKQDEVPRSKDCLNLSEMSLKSLRTFVPSPKYLREKITLPNGIYIDGEFAVEGGKDLKPLPLDSWYKEGQNSEIPQGCSRIALCVWDYKATVLDSDSLAGHSHLTSHLLARLGYKVLQVTHSELANEDKEVKKVQFLQRKLRHLLAE